jgi:uncharacterized protein YndB with AHSA1/START domain
MIMHSIENTIEIAATPDRVLAALTTTSGIRAWFTKDSDIDATAARFRFVLEAGVKEVRFAIDELAPARLAMTCTAETNNADWLGTKLVFALAPAGAGTRVQLVHSGFAARNETYERTIQGWAFFVGSLKRYVETGIGEPHVGPTKAINDAISIDVPAARVLAALTTSAGIAAWWTRDNTVTATEHTYRFSEAGATFRIEQQDARGIALVCTSDHGGMGWLGTRLAFSVESVGAKARVALVHKGFALDSGCYDDCIKGWGYFLKSLKAYLETGTGTPYTPGFSCQ